MGKLNHRVCLVMATTLYFSQLIGCGKAVNSKEKIVDIASTPAKWQSIGNCWIYSTLGWMESLALKNRQTTLNLSETYLTYRHWQEHLPYSQTLNTGGSVQEALRLMTKYGVMLEKDVIPEEAGRSKSEWQKRAEDYIKQSLASGALFTSRDSKTITAELDRAFGINMADVEKKAISLDRLMIGMSADGKIRSMEEEYKNWTAINWFEESIPNEIPGVNPSLSPRQNKVLKVVKAALNAGKPVIMDWFVDFGALDDRGVFSLSNLKKKPNEKQGYHSTVLEDYVVTVNDPSTGQLKTIGEGEVSEAEKSLALNQGIISYFVVKNSWGGLERRDRASYRRGMEGGFHRLEADYLFSSIRNREQDFVTSVISSFMVPREYLSAQ